MTQIIQAQNVNIFYLEEKFGLQLVDDEHFFAEWNEDLPEITQEEKQSLDRVKSNYLSLIKRRPVSEELVKMVVLSPLLDLASFYHPPFYVETEQSIEITVEDNDNILRGRIDVLVLKYQLWLFVIESKQTGFSLLTAIPQALAYMLGSSRDDVPIFGLVTNGDDFEFIKLVKHTRPQYALSDKFTLSKRENELYKVLGILKNIGQVLS